jgi:pimeloyl-ACP methyl ester carboxylesterase
VPRAQANGIELEYETFGDPSNPAILLIMGLGIQLLGWHEVFCNMLVERGFFVIRYDNRDVGLSSKIEDGPEPDLMRLLAGDTSSASYTLDDMADDAAGLLDALGIEKAHLVGISMGGMIGQTLAIRHPDRVLSLTSIMSTTGGQAVGQPRQDVMMALITPAPEDREAFVDYQANLFRLIGSPDYPMPDDQLREIIGQSYDRMHYPPGFLRQLTGIMASGDRTAALASVDVPTLVIHGEVDPLIQVDGGEATAKAIPGAKLVTIAGMGHDFPPQLWQRFVDEIVANAERAATAAPAASD